MVKRRKRCRDCGATGVYLSNKKLCYKCWTKRQMAAPMQLHKKKGPHWEAWKRGVLKAIENGKN